MDTPSEIQHFTLELKKFKVSSNQSSRAKKIAFPPLNYRHLHFTLAPVFCCFLPLLNPLKLLHTCSHCFSQHLCCIFFPLPGMLKCEKRRSWPGCPGEQHQPLCAHWGSSAAGIHSATDPEGEFLFKHFLNILLGWRLKMGQIKGAVNTCRSPWYNTPLISLHPAPEEHSTRF